jgi:hypothetical protein
VQPFPDTGASRPRARPPPLGAVPYRAPAETSVQCQVGLALPFPPRPSAPQCSALSLARVSACPHRGAMPSLRRDTPRGARDRGGGGAGDGGRREPSSPGRARGGGGGGPATSRREERSRPITHPQTTLIYLDWDDTLFPTSALLDSGFLVRGYWHAALASAGTRSVLFLAWFCLG